MSIKLSIPYFGQQRVCLDEVKKMQRCKCKTSRDQAQRIRGQSWACMVMPCLYLCCVFTHHSEENLCKYPYSQPHFRAPGLKHQEAAQFCPDLSRSCSSQKSSWAVNQRQPKLSECLRKSVSLMDLCDPWQLPGNVKLLYTFRYLWNKKSLKCVFYETSE